MDTLHEILHDNYPDYKTDYKNQNYMPTTLTIKLYLIPLGIYNPHR